MVKFLPPLLDQSSQKNQLCGRFQFFLSTHRWTIIADSSFWYWFFLLFLYIYTELLLCNDVLVQGSGGGMATNPQLPQEHDGNQPDKEQQGGCWC